MTGKSTSALLEKLSKMTRTSLWGYLLMGLC